MQHSVFGSLLFRRDGTAERDTGRQHGAVLTTERSIPSVSLTFGALILVVVVGVLVLLRGYTGAVGTGPAELTIFAEPAADEHPAALHNRSSAPSGG